MPKKSDHLISVIVPAYNEEELLPGFIKEVTSYLKKTASNYELLIIENGSKDKTLEIAKVFAKKNKRIKVKHLVTPEYGTALITGIKNASGKYIIIYNVDFWDSRFIDLAKVDLLGCDIINGSKNLPGSDDKRPISRRFITQSFNLLLRFFCGFKGTDTHGIKILRKEKILPIVKRCKTATGILDSELIIRSQRAGLKMLEIPVEIIEKRANRFGLKRILQTPKDILKLYYALLD